MKQREPIDFWWRKMVPADSLRTKVIDHIARNGPSSVYDISKAMYGRPSKGYPSVFKILKELEAENVLKQTKTQATEKRGTKKLYALSEYIGIPTAWAYVGTKLDFAKLLETHRGVFKETKGLDAYRTIWDQLGSDFCVTAARKSFLAIIQGLDDRMQVFNMLVAYILDGTIGEGTIRPLLRANDLIPELIREVRDDLTKILGLME